MGFRQRSTTAFAAVCALLMSLQAVATEETHRLQWIKKSEAMQNLSQLIPAGRDQWGMMGYVARFEGWLPGKAVVDSGELWGYFPLNGEEIKAATFELLVEPIGSTSWVPATVRDRFIENEVVGGADQITGETLYICRGWVDGTMLMSGRLMPTTGICHIPFRTYPTVTEYEVLVINAYGVVSGLVSNAKTN